jgi:hypothetical protein
MIFWAVFRNSEGEKGEGRVTGMVIVLENKKGQPFIPTALELEVETKKGTVPLYRTLCREKVRLSLYQVERFSGFVKRPALRFKVRLPLYQTQLFCALVQPLQGFGLIARNPLALSNGED